MDISVKILINLQLQEFGYPNIIIRDKEKHLYYKTFSCFREKKSTKEMEQIIYKVITFHKQLKYKEQYEHNTKNKR